MANILAAIIGGAFSDRDAAARALGELQSAGFRNAQLLEAEKSAAVSPTAQSRFVFALTSLGFSRVNAKHLADYVRFGGAIVTVRPGNRSLEAVDILQTCGGDVGSQARIAASRPLAGYRTALGGLHALKFGV